MKIISLQILLPSPQTLPGLRTLSRLEPSSLGRRLLQLPVATVLNLLAVQQRPRGALGPVRMTLPSLVPRG